MTKEKWTEQKLLVVICNLLLVFLSCTAIKNQQHEEVLQSVRDGPKIPFTQSAQRITLGKTTDDRYFKLYA